jgi:hypothetical protein
MKRISFIAGCLALMLVTPCQSEDDTLRAYEGVVTAHIIPAKVIQVNRIIEKPKPGTSYIGDEKVLVEIDENVEIMANWTVVRLKYCQYPEPKIISYEILSEKVEITVKYRAVDLEVVGDMSAYIKQ